jgi:hypothetical protein
VARVVPVEVDLHDDGPDVDACVEDHHGPEAELRAPALGDVFEVEDEA